MPLATFPRISYAGDAIDCDNLVIARHRINLVRRWKGKDVAVIGKWCNGSDVWRRICQVG